MFLIELFGIFCAIAYHFMGAHIEKFTSLILKTLDWVLKDQESCSGPIIIVPDHCLSLWMFCKKLLKKQGWWDDKQDISHFSNRCNCSRIHSISFLIIYSSQVSINACKVRLSSHHNKTDFNIHNSVDILNVHVLTEINNLMLRVKDKLILSHNA